MEPTATPGPSDPTPAPLAGVAWLSASCLGCGYCLARLPAGRCPECGRGFDPALPETVGPREHARFWDWVGAAAWFCTPGPVYGAAGAGLVYLLAWAMLGRQPQAYLDDPKFIPGISTLHGLVLLALLLSPILTALGIVLACVAAAARNRWRLLVPPTVLSLLAWPIGVLTIWLYPARLWIWWMD